jgi:hypothetical protein
MLARAARTARPCLSTINFQPSTFSMTNIYTLRAGDIVQYAGQPCQVIRVTDCAAVVAVVQKPRTITPRFGKPVTIQPAPKLERISTTSALPILNR